MGGTATRHRSDRPRPAVQGGIPRPEPRARAGPPGQQGLARLQGNPVPLPAPPTGAGGGGHMNAEDFIKQALIDGSLTYHHLVYLTEYFQESQKLDADGKPGPNTLAALERWGHVPMPRQQTPFLNNPLPTLLRQDNTVRRAVVTSG